MFSSELNNSDILATIRPCSAMGGKGITQSEIFSNERLGIAIATS